MNHKDHKVFAEKCGVFGIFGHEEAAAFTVLGLHALQHRGQEAAGIVSTDGKSFYIHRAHSHVGEGFGEAAVVAKLKGTAALGHNRYATSGGITTIQPLFAELSAVGGCALAHNGDLTNALSLRKSLVKRGCLFQSAVDTELFIHLLALSKSDGLLNRLSDALHQVEGAYSLAILTKDRLIGVRDPYGVRPLVLGRLGKASIVCSETCALDIIGAEFVRDIEPGEVVVIDKKGIKSYHPFLSTNPHFCIFEYVYFSRPDSVIEGKSVYNVRKRIGAGLAAEGPAPNADLVVPVADSGVAAALGYAAATGLPFDLGLIRNHYVGRTFIEPSQKIRHLGVRLKHNANRAVIEGKKIVLVDDSIVRGTTSQKIITMMRTAGAKEIHMRIGAPPMRHSCFYGVDTPRRRNLIAARKDPQQIAKMLKVDSLVFLSLEGLRKAVSGDEKTTFCEACFSGDYPIPLVDKNLAKDGRPLLVD